MSTTAKIIGSITFLCILFGIIALSTMSYRVEPGYVGLIVNVSGSDKSAITTVSPGLYWLNFTEKMYVFPTFKQTYAFTDDKKEGSATDESILLQTSDGLEFKARVGIVYTLNPNKISQIFQEYRMGIEEITSKYVRTLIRNKFIALTSQRKIDDVIGLGKNQLLDTLNVIVKRELYPRGINIESINLIGSFDLPKTIKDQIELKLSAVQRSEKCELELREAIAQAKKDSMQAAGYAQAIIIKARAEAEANKLKQTSLTALLVQSEAIRKWNGYLPTYMSGSSGLPFIGNISK